MRISNYTTRRVTIAVASSALAVASLLSTTAAAAIEPPSLRGAALWVDPNSQAQKQVDAWRKSRPSDAAVLSRIAEQPQAVWLGEWSGDVRRAVDGIVSAAARAGAVPVLVAYNIPQRDCGSYSAGGANGADRYAAWIRQFADGLRNRRAIVVLEPDALAGMDCLSAEGQRQRTGMLRGAVKTLKSSGANVYIDAGHARWHSPEQIAERLSAAGIAQADGFALNVSNFHSNALNVSYGEKVSARTGGKHFVIDSSRNGIGIDEPGQWCNPRNQALGSLPTTRSSHPLVDAMLWIKRPGESDGTCNGGPSAGRWWPDYALELVQRQSKRMALALASP